MPVRGFFQPETFDAYVFALRCILCLRRRDVPFVTVVTDLGGAHPTWFNKKVDKVFVASDAVKGVAFDEGVRAAQVSG